MKPMRKTSLLIAGIASISLFAGYQMLQPATDIKTTGAKVEASAATAMVQVTLPTTLTATAQLGQTAFDAKCAACHGLNAAGNVNAAPPLIHKIYEPSHHGDESFQRAVSQGVQAHHWRFGNMARVDGLTRADVTNIIAYIREVQRANGIF